MKYFNTFRLLLFAFYTQDNFLTHERKWSLQWMQRPNLVSALRVISTAALFLRLYARSLRA